MKVKEYLVKRIEDLERDLKSSKNESAGFREALDYSKECNGKLCSEIDKLKASESAYKKDRERIREIIASNVIRDTFNKRTTLINILECEDDFKELTSILEIEPKDCVNLACQEDNSESQEDNSEKSEDPAHVSDRICIPDECIGCEHERQSALIEPCKSCFDFNNYTKK